MTNDTYYRCQFLLEVPRIESVAERAARWNELSDYLLSHQEYIECHSEILSPDSTN